MRHFFLAALFALPSLPCAAQAAAAPPVSVAPPASVAAEKSSALRFEACAPRVPEPHEALREERCSRAPLQRAGQASPPAAKAEGEGAGEGARADG